MHVVGAKANPVVPKLDLQAAHMAAAADAAADESEEYAYDSNKAFHETLLSMRQCVQSHLPALRRAGGFTE